MSYEDLPRSGYSKFSLEVWFLKPGSKFFEFLSFRNLMSVDRDECRSSDDPSQMKRSLLVLERIFFNFLRFLIYDPYRNSPPKKLSTFEKFSFFEIVWNMKEEDLTRSMIQPTWLSHQYFSI